MTSDPALNISYMLVLPPAYSFLRSVQLSVLAAINPYSLYLPDEIFAIYICVLSVIFSNCTVAIHNLSFMQFIAIKLRLWISNLLMNEQKAAALADVRVR